MALRRKRDSSMIWPGFVDAVTTLLMVLMFVLTIFTVMQSVLRETITTQTSELDELTAQVAGVLAERDAARGEVSDLQAAQAQLLSEKEALDLAIAKARSEIDAGAEIGRA